MILGLCCYGGVQSPKLFEIVDYLLDSNTPTAAGTATGKRAIRAAPCIRPCPCWKPSGVTRRTGIVTVEGNYGKYSRGMGVYPEEALFRSCRTDEIIDKKMLMLSWPCRWRYDILRCMDYFASGERPTIPAWRQRGASTSERGGAMAAGRGSRRTPARCTSIWRKRAATAAGTRFGYCGC